MNRLISLFFAILGLTGHPPFALRAVAPAAPAAMSSADSRHIQTQFENMPIHFIENRGQVDQQAAYYVQGRSANIYFTAQGVTFVLADETAAGKQSALKLDFLQANPMATLRAEGQTPAAVSYFKGPRDQWRTNLASYSTLVYQELWPGIDLTYTGSGNRLKYTFLVKPGADPGQIRFAYRGAASIHLNEAGQLDLSTPGAGFRDEKPYSYQEVNGRRVEVATAYELLQANTGPHTYGFRVENYDRSIPLVLDPITSIYSGYLGGSGSDRALGIAVDAGGNAYVTGATTSLDFPVSSGPNTIAHNFGDVFVAKLNPSGTLVYAGYIGGSGEDIGFDVAVDGEGNAYVTGATSSTAATFPVRGGPYSSYSGGSYDAFVAKVAASGLDLVYCGYIGGSGTDGGTSIAVNVAGNAFITGATNSTEATFPVVGGPSVTFKGGTLFGDAFVAKVSASGTGLVYSGYIGGTAEDAGIAIAIDLSGNAYVAGATASADFPTGGGLDAVYNGGLRDGFVAKVGAAGNTLVYSGYIGGAGADTAFGIAVDGSGAAYVSGETSSSEASFPVAVGPDLTFNGGSDAFIAKVNGGGSGLVYCGYVGGSGKDGATGIAVDSSGNAYITGATTSSAASFPVTSGPDLTFNGGAFFGDAFAAKLNSAGTALVYNSYIGGEDDDIGYSIAVDSSGNAYVAGETSSAASFPTTGVSGLSYNGGANDGFVTRIGDLTGITLNTMPAGLGITVDGTAYTTPQTLQWIPGSTHTISTTSPQAGGTGTRFVFVSWSDGGAIAHNVTAPSSATTYTATFSTQFLLTATVSPAAGGTVSATTGFYNSGASVPLAATANAGFVFANWSGDLSGTTNPQSVTMNAPHSVTANFNALTASMSGAISTRSGPPAARIWTITLTNNGPGAAGSASITAFTLTQTFGVACSPAVITPAFPLSVGTIAPGGSASGAITIDFTGCNTLARFTATVPFSANAGAVTGSIVRYNLFQ